MSMEAYNLAELGKKGIVTDDGLLGQYGRFLDVNHSSTDSIKPLLSQMAGIAMLVRNESGGTLEAGTACKWDNGSTYGPGEAVGGAASATDIPAGIVDPWISSDVADDEFFWLIVHGPAKAKFTTGTTLDESNLLVTGASGRVAKATVGTTSDHYSIATCLEAVDTAIASDTLFRVFVHCKFGR